MNQQTITGKCRICGDVGEGSAFNVWVRPTFTDWDKLHDGSIICTGCLFWFEERSEELAQLVGKDKPQRMRNYSHFVVGGQWIPLSKSHKSRMAELLNEPFPELAIIADSGQKHIAFRARCNSAGGASGWVQFEEDALFIEPRMFHPLLSQIETLYEGGFSKTELESGIYQPYRIRKFGIEAWHQIEQYLRQNRGRLLFRLALFLAQKGAPDGRGPATEGDSIANGNLERDSSGLQIALPDEYLAAIRGPGQELSVYEQPRQVRQLSLF